MLRANGHQPRWGSYWVLSLIYQQVLFKFLRRKWTLSVCYWRISCQRDSWPLHVSCLALQGFWRPWVWLLDQLFDFGRVICTVTSLIQRLGTVHYRCQRMLCAKSSSGAIILTTVVTRFGRQALNLRCYHFLMLASPAGGGFTAQVGGKVAVGSWSLEEMGRSSTFREPRATRRVLESFAPHLKGSEVLHRTDNKNTEIILSFGSRKADLHAEAVSIYKLCRVYDIRLTVEWVSRDYNEVADELSRIEDANDYMLDRSCFRSLDKLWGPHLVDRFASEKTKQLDRFCSRFLNPGCEAADAFTVSWAGVNNWLFPPPFLVPRVLRHMSVGKEDGTLLVPEWRSAPWWPLLVTRRGSWREFVVDSRRIQPYDGIFVPGSAASCIFSSGTPAFSLLALKLKFSSISAPF